MHDDIAAAAVQVGVFGIDADAVAIAENGNVAAAAGDAEPVHAHAVAAFAAAVEQHRATRRGDRTRVRDDPRNIPLAGTEDIDIAGAGIDGRAIQHHAGIVATRIGTGAAAAQEHIAAVAGDRAGVEAQAGGIAAGEASGGIGLPVEQDIPAIAVQCRVAEADAGEAVVEVVGVGIERHRQRGAVAGDAEVAAADRPLRVRAELQRHGTVVVEDVHAFGEIDVAGIAGSRARAQGDARAGIQRLVDVAVLDLVAQHCRQDGAGRGAGDHIEVRCPQRPQPGAAVRTGIDAQPADVETAAAVRRNAAADVAATREKAAEGGQ